MIRSLVDSRKIVAAMVDLLLHRQDSRPLETYIRQFSLMDLVLANYVVALNKNEAKGDGTLPVFCDDPVIAALYVALHGTPEANHRDVTPVIELSDRALCLVTMEREEMTV